MDIKAENLTELMSYCITLAKKAKANGESPVGAILVHEGKIIAEGIESSRVAGDITRHAEIEAIRQARSELGSDLSKCILVTTHEPCIMCSYVIRHHRISSVVFGLKVEDVGGFSSEYKILTDKSITKWKNPPKIIGGVLQEQCKKLHE